MDEHGRNAASYNGGIKKGSDGRGLQSKCFGGDHGHDAITERCADDQGFAAVDGMLDEHAHAGADNRTQKDV